MTWRKVDSRWGWNRPTFPGWLGYTVAVRLGIVFLIVSTLARDCGR